MKLSQFSNFGDHIFGLSVIEGITLDSFVVADEYADGRVRYATARVTSKSTGEVYNLRYKLNGGEEDVLCSCPAHTQRRYFCKHAATLLNAVATYERDTAEARQEAEAELAMIRYHERRADYTATLTEYEYR